MHEVDVIVVGLGPTGATLAGLLGQRGVRVAVFDRMPDLYPLPRAIGLDQEVMRTAQELGIADRLAPHVAAYRPSEYRGMEGQLIKRLDFAPPPYRLGWSPNYVFDQPDFERILRQRLTELPSVQVTCSAQVLAVGQVADHAWADVVLPGDARPTRYVAPYIVACDGGSSPIRESLGIKLEDLGFDEPWLVVDAMVSEAKLAELPQTQVQYCEAERPCTFVVGVGRHRRWEIMLNPGDSLASNFPLEELWPLLQRWLRPGEGELWRAAAYRFHSLVAHEWRRDRIFLAGDSAHMTPPFMAQGMGQGMRDAMNLAWKLERALRSRASNGLLDTYQAERRPHVLATTRAAMALGRVICERDAERARERDARLLAEQGGAVRTQYRQDMIPGLSAGLMDPEAADAGVVAPQPFLRADGAITRADEITGRGFRLVARVACTPEERHLLSAELQSLGGIALELSEEPSGASAPQWIHALEDEPVMGPWLDRIGRSFAIVRPDHYVYATASTASEALEQLKRLRTSLA